MSTQTPHVDTVMSNLVIVLEGITQVRNFHRDIKKVYDEIIPVDELTPDCIVLEFGDDHFKNNDGGGHTLGLFEKVFPVYIHCFLYTTGKIRKAQNAMQADLESVLFRDLYGNTLNGAAQQVMLQDVQRWGTTVDSPNCGITAILNVHYRTKITDPTKKG